MTLAHYLQLFFSQVSLLFTMSIVPLAVVFLLSFFEKGILWKRLIAFVSLTIIILASVILTLADRPFSLDAYTIIIALSGFLGIAGLFITDKLLNTPSHRWAKIFYVGSLFEAAVPTILFPFTLGFSFLLYPTALPIGFIIALISGILIYRN